MYSMGKMYQVLIIMHGRSRMTKQGVLVIMDGRSRV